MRRLIVDTYRFVYLVSRAKTFSVVIATIYVAILNMIILFGLGQLTQGWLRTNFVYYLFIPPFYYLSGGAMLWVTARYKPSQKAIAKEAKKTTDYTFIIVYSLAALIIVLYMQYGTKINFNTTR